MLSPRFNGILLRQLRKKAGLTLRSLAGEFYRQFGYYVSYQSVDLWEQGRNQLKGHHLVMLAAILGVEEVVFYDGGQGEGPVLRRPPPTPPGGPDPTLRGVTALEKTGCEPQK